MNDYTHCPGNPGGTFSPVAPSDYCSTMPVNAVPEPSSLMLVLLAFALLALVRKVRHARS